MKAWVGSFLMIGILASSAFADVNLSINKATGALDIANDATHVTSLRQGTISSLVKAGDSSFRVSYGKDMTGAPTIVIYRDSSMSGEVKLNSFGDKITVGEKAALTITLNAKNEPVSYESGMLGNVSIADAKLSPRQKFVKQSESVVASTSKKKAKEVAPKPEAKPETKAEVAAAPAPVEKPEAKPEAKPVAKTEAAPIQMNVVAKTQGEVVAGIKGSAGGSKVVRGEALSEGSFISTAKSSIAVVQIIPDVYIQLDEKSTIELTKVKINPDGGYDVELNLKTGTVICDIQNGGTPNKNFKIVTPEGTASAHGTNYIVTTLEGKMLVRVIRGLVAVLESMHQNAQVRIIQAGNKVIIAVDSTPAATGGSAPQVTVSETQPLTQEDKAAVKQADALTKDNKPILASLDQNGNATGNGNGNGTQTPGSTSFASNDLAPSSIDTLVQQIAAALVSKPSDSTATQ